MTSYVSPLCFPISIVADTCTGCSCKRILWKILNMLVTRVQFTNSDNPLLLSGSQLSQFKFLKVLIQRMVHLCTALLHAEFSPPIEPFRVFSSLPLIGLLGVFLHVQFDEACFGMKFFQPCWAFFISRLAHHTSRSNFQVESKFFYTWKRWEWMHTLQSAWYKCVPLFSAKPVVELAWKWCQFSSRSECICMHVIQAHSLSLKG